MNTFALQPDLQGSPGTLTTVVVAHVAAALLIVQVLQAKPYVEPTPIMVSLLLAPQQPEVPPEPQQLRPAEPGRQFKREPVPVPAPLAVAAPLPMPAPIPVATTQRVPLPMAAPVPAPAPVPESRAMPEPEPVPVEPEPLPEVRHEPEPVERVALPEPAPKPAVEIPPPLPQPVAEAGVVQPPAPVVAPAPQPITPVPSPNVVQAPREPQEITMSSQMLAAAYLRNPKPSYPNLSRRLSEQGTVVLRVFVTMGGDATRVELKESSGFSRLDHAALSAVQNWKFVPAKRGEQPVAAWVVVPIKFSLKG